MSSRQGSPDAPPVDDLRAEVDALRARVAELTRTQPLAPSPHRDTLEVLRPALIHWSGEGVITHWNKRAEQLFGIPAAEALGQPLIDLIPPSGSPREYAVAWMELMSNGKAARSRSLHETRDGRTIVCDWTSGVGRDSQGKTKEIVSAIQDVSAEIGKSQMVRDSQQILLGLVDNLPSLVSVKDRKGRCILANRQLESVLHLPREKIIGMTEAQIFPPEIAEEFHRRDQEAIETGRAVEIEEVVTTPDGPRTYLTVRFPLYEVHGALLGLCVVATDITQHKRADAERAALQERVIAAQRDALRELSTPLLPVVDGVLVLPLLGAIDSTRAGQILEALLDGINKQRAHTAILDITGVRVVDAEVAAALVRSARAARLLGAKVVITGVSPDVARTLVELGTELSGIVTLATLESGITFALGRRPSAS